jgi:hypothetical protein
MKPDELQAFGRFWDFVRRAELDLREHSHRGHPPPDVDSEPWDQDFADAYTAIRRFLAKFRQKRTFFPPLRIPLRSTPYEAETAHEALMVFLNKPDQLYGSAKALDSKEYLDIKAEAMEERRLRQAFKEELAKKRVRAAVIKEAQSDLLVFVSFLAEHHFPARGEPVAEPLTQKKIGKALNWAQARVSRCFRRWFKSNRGMSVYRRHCQTGEITRGFLKKYNDGDISIEAYLERDEVNDEDDED